MNYRSQTFKHLSFIALAIVLLTSCYEQETEARSKSLKSSIDTRFSNDTFLDDKGRLWEKTRTVEYINFDGAPPHSTKNGIISEPSPKEMKLDEIAETYRPITEFNGVEYRLSDDDTLELAKKIQESIIQFDGKELVGLSDKEEKNLAPLKQPIIIGSSDGRVNINNIADLNPQSKIAGRGISGPGCTAFKLINNYTAITAAHCVYNRDSGNWYTRQDWWFGAGATHNPGGTSRLPLPKGCYDRTIPSGWISSGGTENDYAIIRFKTSQSGGPWCPHADYNTGWLGYSSPGDGIDFDVKVEGYPVRGDEDSPSGRWAYPTLWHHHRGLAAWTVTLLYPTRIFHYIDTSPGQSGAPIHDTSIDRVRGIHTGYTWVFPLGFRNEGRRLSPDIITWFRDNAGSL